VFQIGQCEVVQANLEVCEQLEWGILDETVVLRVVGVSLFGSPGGDKADPLPRTCDGRGVIGTVTASVADFQSFTAWRRLTVARYATARRTSVGGDLAVRGRRSEPLGRGHGAQGRFDRTG